MAPSDPPKGLTCKANGFDEEPRKPFASRVHSTEDLMERMEVASSNDIESVCLAVPERGLGRHLTNGYRTHLLDQA